MIYVFIFLLEDKGIFFIVLGISQNTINYEKYVLIEVAKFASGFDFAKR